MVTSSATRSVQLRTFRAAPRQRRSSRPNCIVNIAKSTDSLNGVKKHSIDGRHGGHQRPIGARSDTRNPGTGILARHTAIWSQHPLEHLYAIHKFQPLSQAVSPLVSTLFWLAIFTVRAIPLGIWISLALRISSFSPHLHDRRHSVRWFRPLFCVFFFFFEGFYVV